MTVESWDLSRGERKVVFIGGQVEGEMESWVEWKNFGGI